jgi:5-methylcytosine-specific restriction endonuclease McrA
MIIMRDEKGRFVNKNLPQNKCVDCNKQISNKATRCKSCANTYYNKLGIKGVKYKKRTQKFKSLMSKKMTGRIISEKQKIKISKTNKLKGITPPKEYWFKKGHTPKNKNPASTRSLNKKLRDRIDFKLWREKVFIRDDFTCQKCMVRGRYIEAHHLISVKDCIIENKIYLVYDVNNGLTLCRPCHMLVHNWKTKNKKNMESD